MKMKKCSKHGCEMVIKKMAVGWGDESELVCPKCEEENKSSVGGSRAVFSIGRAGWQ